MIKSDETLVANSCERFHKSSMSISATVPTARVGALADDAVLGDFCAELLQARLARLSIVDPHWDLLYLGRWALDDQDRAVAEGIKQPGLSYCTFGYLLSASGLAAVLNCGFERALIPVDELIPALYMDHPREDIRSLYPRRLRASAGRTSITSGASMPSSAATWWPGASQIPPSSCVPHAGCEPSPHSASSSRTLRPG